MATQSHVCRGARGDSRPGLLFGQLGPLVYAAILWVSAASVVRWHEEPVLARRFGADYDIYRRAVPTWWPRMHPWTPTAPPPR
jgi:protein-S-isoprenylcysteine O-methyltransferase Ste14